MKWLKNLFNKKDSKTISTDIQPEKTKEVEIRGYCGHCNGIITLEERYTKQQGVYYHKLCWREMVKLAWQR